MSGVLPAQCVRLLGCPACGQPVNAAEPLTLRCAGCAAPYPVTDGVAELRLPQPPDSTTETVRRFYTEAPFPGYPPRDSLASLRARAERSEFARLLDQAIPPDARVLELGCGTGQMSLFLARHQRLVIGADLTRASLALAAAAARRFGLADRGRLLFVETDLAAPGLAAGAFDVVYCSGVLHHTPAPADSFRRLVRLCRPGGIIVLGLYNAYARLPHRLRRLVARLTGHRLIPLDPVLRDRAAQSDRKQAWLRDQYLHPEEHRHTLAQVQRWFQASAVTYLRTYPDTLIAAEPLTGSELFTPAADNWGAENVLSQLAWMGSLGHEGGLFITIGQRLANDPAPLQQTG